ncbi:hypothetical protein TYRP_022554 [Tyrophagus putrescentiae]|nr:hypothetical protein TYRP_022554 [Tyrophagus putrescentiae]
MFPIVDSRATGHQRPHSKCGRDTGPPLEAHSLVAGSTAPSLGHSEPERGRDTGPPLEAGSCTTTLLPPRGSKERRTSGF